MIDEKNKDIKRFTLRIDKDAHQKTKKYSFLTGYSMNDIISRALEEFLEKKQVKENLEK